MRIAALGGREPLVEVIAVPDTATLDALATQLRAATVSAPPRTVTPPPPPAPAFASSLAELAAQRWPAAAGELLRTRVTATPGAPVSLELEVTHLGPPLGRPGEQLLAEAWGDRLALPITIVDRALPTAPIEAPASAGLAWIGDAASVIDRTAGVPGVHLCLTTPPVAEEPAPARRRRAPSPPDASAPVRAILEGLSRGRTDIESEEGVGWSLRIAREPCHPSVPPSPSPPPSPPSTPAP